MSDATSDQDALVVITGASRGIGRAMAAAVPVPARVVDVSRSGADGLEHLEADLSDPAAWSQLASELGRLVTETQPDRAVLVHAAGTLTPIGFVGEVDAGDYRDAVLLNSAAAQVIGHHFLAATGGVPRREVVMITSGAATSVYEGWSAYGAGKAALDHWVRNVGAEQRRRGGATVVSIAPGVVATAMQEQIRATDPEDFPAVDKFVGLHREGRLEDPDDVAPRLWALIEQGLESGSVVDIRDLG